MTVIKKLESVTLLQCRQGIGSDSALLIECCSFLYVKHVLPYNTTFPVTQDLLKCNENTHSHGKTCPQMCTAVAVAV